MGIEYRGVICVGYTFDEIEHIMEKLEFEGDADDFVESEDMDSFSPYFDAHSEDCIYGNKVVASDDYSYAEINMDHVNIKVLSLKQKLYTKYGVEAGTYLMAHGY